MEHETEAKGLSRVELMERGGVAIDICRIRHGIIGTRLRLARLHCTSIYMVFIGTEFAGD